MKTILFRDREDAARQLAERLKGRELIDPLVLGIPRGGVVIGAVLASERWAELDVVLARKLRAPGQPELALGAVAEDGKVYLDDRLMQAFPAAEDYLASERDFQLAEIARRKKLFRDIRPRAQAAGRSVIVTDDGIATGSTMIAALQAARSQDVHELIVAVPVAPPDRLAEVRRWCDEAICLHSPEVFWAIGQFYADFTPVEEAETLELLRRFAPVAPNGGE
jgi:putative phosphoribosyl transferase